MADSGRRTRCFESSQPRACSDCSHHERRWRVKPTSYSSAQRSSPGTQTGRRLKRLLLRGNESARSVPARKSAVLPDRGPASSTFVGGRSSQDSSTRTYICWVAPEIVDEPSLRNFERTALPKVMTGFISHGITTVRSTSDPLPYIAQLRDRLERGQLVGPRLLITGPTPSSPSGFPVTMCGDNPFCRQMGFRVIESEEQARQVVRELSRAKVDAVKLVVDDFYGKVPALSDAVISALVDETHRTGLRIIAHVSVAKDVDIARRLIELGVDEFVHLFVSDRRGGHFALAPINDLSPPNPAEVSQIAGLLVARNIPVTTTVSNGDAYRDTTGAERVLFGGSPPYTPAMRQRLEWALNTVRGFADAGVKLVVGTDDRPPRVTVSYGMTRASSLVPGPFTKWSYSITRDCPHRRS